MKLTTTIMNKLRSVLLALLLCLPLASAISQPRYKIIDFAKLNDAVTQVNRIVTDGNGLMWFSTNNGLYRYDGYEFRSFKSHSGDGVNMLSNNIHYMYSSSEGGIWTVVSKRAFLFDTHTYRFVDVLKNYEKEHGVTFKIHKLRTLPCGDTWLFTTDGKFLVLEDARPTEQIQLMGDYDPKGDVTAVCDNKQRSWVLTSNQTVVYKNRKHQVFKQTFRYILAASRRVWLATADGKLFFYDEKSRTIRQKTHALLSSPIIGLTAISDGRVALQTVAGVLLMSADGQHITATPVNKAVVKLMEDGNGHLWFFALDGSLSLSGMDCKSLKDVSGFSADKCNIMRDNHGSVWVFTDKNAYYTLQDSPETLIRYEGDKLEGNINNTINDGQGGYWFINKNRAYRLTFESPHYTKLPLNHADQIRCVAKDQQNRLLVGGRYDEAITLFSESGKRLGWLGRDGRVSQQPVSFGAAVYSSLLDRYGNLWLGTKKDGVFRLRIKQDGNFLISQYAKDDKNPAGSISDNEIYDFASDSQGRLWIATHKGGLCCIVDAKAEVPKFVHQGSGLAGWKPDANTGVRSLLVTPSNHLLVGTSNGLYAADISSRDVSSVSFTSHQRETSRSSSLTSNFVTDMIRTSGGKIFITTNDGGVNELLTSDLSSGKFNFHHYNMSTGFPVDIALAAVEYKDALWITAPNQLVELQLKDSPLPAVNSFLLRENPKFASCSPAMLKDGRCVFGADDGAMMVNLDELKNATFLPPLVMTGVSKENGAVDYSLSWNDTIRLSPKERDLTLWFSALDFENTELVAYAYRTDSLKPWTYIGQNHSITLAQMRPGTYQLTVRSTDSNGAWCDNEKTVTIIVEPTFWETPWAVLLIIAIIGAVAGIVTYTLLYIRRIKRQQHETMEAYLALLSEHNAPKEETAEQQPQAPEPPSLPATSPEDEQLMQRLMAFIETHLDDADITIDDMASAVAVSRSGLHRKIKHLLGTSPMEFLREARIRKAIQLLSDTSMPISDIAYKCGFSDPKYFSKCFKASTGKTPTEYKNSPS